MILVLQQVSGRAGIIKGYPIRHILHHIHLALYIFAGQRQLLALLLLRSMVQLIGRQAEQYNPHQTAGEQRQTGIEQDIPVECAVRTEKLHFQIPSSRSLALQ